MEVKIKIFGRFPDAIRKFLFNFQFTWSPGQEYSILRVSDIAWDDYIKPQLKDYIDISFEEISRQ